MQTPLKSVSLILAFCGLLFAGTPVFADSGSSLPEAGTTPWSQVINEIAGQIAVLLPEDGDFRQLAIAEIEGDDGTIEEALTAAIQSASSLKIIERADLTRLLAEQGVQLSPYTDPNSTVEPGMIQGVEALLLGRVVKQIQNPLYSSLQVFLKLNNVETGEVVFARTFEATCIPPVTRYLVISLLVLFFLLLLRRRASKKRKKFFNEYSRKEAADRQEVEIELKKSRDNLNRTHEILQSNDDSKAAVTVHQTKEELNNLLQKLEHGPVVHPQAVDREMVRELNRHNKIMKELTKKVRAASEKVLEAAGKDRAIDALLSQLSAHLKDAANTSYDRKTGTS